ncbi:prolow-density lipoprotein receptor-related protein 1-like isoform X2 [Rhincodon typus]|uniref:prolow-density lipoprotein receptor-related protein 1-like isoform X2 n=1 Tax=Rhincodon typus TaxID=259920 RepID=UPI00202DF864|nr:prolow-density lipoprotein receptor-related protein 1-like isoform X2 [Rhincodon typus]
MGWIIFKWLLLGIYTNCLILSDRDVNIVGYARCDEKKIQCNDGTFCLDKKNVCDGKTDCADGSDEINCPNTTCLGMQWPCRNQKCIPMIAKCNGVDECGDNSDEEFCEAEHKETCSEYKCSNKCLSENKICDGISDCVDGIDEPESCGKKCWDNGGGCSMLCEETIWGAHCFCPAGMILQADKNCTEGTNYLVTAGQQSLGILDLNSKKYTSMAVHKEVVAVAYDLAKAAFYWVDVEGSIFWSLAKNSSIPIYRDKGVTSIAIDWFTGLIYWTNLLEERICAGMSNGNGFATILEKNIRPEQLLLLPAKSCMFWVNQRDNIHSKVHIETAGMDGSGRKVIVVLDSLKPIGLTLDYPTETLYWFNEDYESVESINVDGTGRFSVSNLDITKPQGFSVSEGWFYWSEANKILRISHHLRRPKEVLVDPAVAFILTITNQQQKSSHQCQKAECSHICLLSPLKTKGYKCACPQGMYLVSGKCEGNRSMCTINNGGCSERDTCIQHTNGVYCLCPDGEDCSPDTWEVQQDYGTTLQCDRTFFLCDDGSECVSMEYKCDGDRDCPDGSDEIGCSEVCDEPDAFHCSDGTKCIQGELRCDGIEQCPDGSDEIGCSQESDICGFWCDDNQRCIPSDWICDGSEDCTDKTDEFNCGCSSDDFICNDGQCISLAFRCDSKYDCKDHSDEHNCPKQKPLCKPDEVMCPVSKECIIKEWWCDDDVDCEDGMDEQNCKLSKVKCSEFQWTCGDYSQCIPDFWQCDGQRDCKDGSDEVKCQPRLCTSSEFQCATLMCINMSLVCNGKDDCTDSSDEGGDCDVQDCKDCMHVCYKTPHGPKCGCEIGFKFMADFNTCIDIDECKELPTRPCSQICLNMNGTYSCSCHSGFLLHHDGYSCKVTGAEPVLLVTVHHDILLYGLHSAKKDIVPEVAKSAIVSMDYDWKEKVIFWVDTYSESIKWMKLNQQEKGTLIKEIQSDCVAVDWVGRNIYWTDGVSSCILAAKLNMALNGPQEYTIVVDTDIDQPHSLVLQPLNGLMYWAEIGSEPQIERAGMDGTNRKLLIKSRLGWPTSLTIDPLGRKLLWADGQLHCIGVANLDGTNIKLFQLTHTRRPFAVALFEDEIFWSDMELRTVQKVDRLGKNRTVLLKRNVQPHGLKVMHEILQPQVYNPCEEMGCKHFCLLGPGLKGSCQCGPGMLLADDGLTCLKSEDQPFLLMISPTVLLQVYLKHLQPDTGLKALPEHLAYHLINNQVASADYVWKDKLVYFSDSEEGIVGNVMLGSNSSSVQRIFQVNDIISLTVDWLSGNLYWITRIPNVIEVASVNGAYRLVLIDNLYHSNSLSLHPPDGIMCFSEWGSEDQKVGPRIECSQMDGQKRKVLWKKCRLPTSLLLAESGTRLYWIDLGHNVIDSVLLDGSEFREIQVGLEAQSVFAYGEDILFWTTIHDGYTRMWYSMMGQKKQLWFEVQQKIVGLKVYSRQQQQGYNFCSEKNGGCDHLCLAYPGGRSCRCSMGYLLINGSKCEAMECPPETWQCQDQLSCILNKQVCDGKKHCADGSDEMECFLTWEQSALTTHVLPRPSVSPSTQEHSTTTSKWLPVTATYYPESHSISSSSREKSSTALSHEVSLKYANVSTVTEKVSTSQMVNFSVTQGAGRSSSCTAQMCNMRGRCSIVNGMVTCKCHEGYTGRFCEEEEMQGVSVLLILGLLALVLLVVVGTIIFKKKRAAKRRARANLQQTTGRGNQTFRNEAFVEVPEMSQTTN